MKAAFVERSGVLHERVSGKLSLTDVPFYPFAERALSQLSLREYLIVIIHNGQETTDRPIAQLLNRKINEKIQRLAFGRYRFVSCFHDPEGDCPCRMPKPGMITMIQNRDEVDLGQSIFFAGSVEGIEAAEQAGVGTIMLMKTGKRNWRKPKDSAVRHFADLEKAIESLG